MQTPSISSRLLLGIMGLALVVIGAVTAVMLWHSFRSAMETRSWPATACLVVRSQVEASQPDPREPAVFRASVRYRYAVAGQTYEGSRIKRGEDRSMRRDKAASICEAHRLGKEATCFVNPARPDEAVLEHASKAAIYTIWFPMLFVVGGSGMIRRALR